MPSILHTVLERQLSALRQERRDLLATAGDHPVGGITVRQLLGGMRGVNALVCDTSVVDPDKGLIIRGIPIAHLAERRPEEVFFLLLCGRLPDTTEVQTLIDTFTPSAPVPDYVWDVLRAMPPTSHPMAMLSAAVTAMDEMSAFRQAYEKGLRREEHWKPALDDAIRLIAAIPHIAAGVYHVRVGGTGPPPDPHAGTDWTTRFARGLGIADEHFARYLEIATVVQSDHEGAHASALTCHTVGSVLSTLFLAVPAGWNALAGPLHGLASQTCADWVLGAIDRYGGEPDDEQVREYVRETIAAGRVVPGYGHAVLRAQDPRYLAILAFGQKHASRSPAFRTVTRMSRIIPGILMEGGKVKNPWPNVDAINGALFHHYGISDTPFYTVFFAAALAFGFCAQYVLNRAMGTPITRPRSVTTAWLRAQVSAD